MSEVKIWEESIVLPTYEVGKPDKNPMFLEKRVYQGSTGKIYPYPATQDICQTKKDVPWKAVMLENEYLKIMVLPELGGRIQRAYDKTNGYDFVYYNHVIKPALVGLLGPWISGGIEFNWPQHHRPTTYMAVDYKIRENKDGSKSLLLGDTDQINGTKVITTITIYPGRAYIEIRGQLYNRTPLPQTFLWWANPAVPVNDYTQSIFPPDVHSVYDHGKRAVSRFPIATGEYYKHDYSQGVDISRYKNIPVPTSYMAESSQYNFVGGYDYQKKAGLLHVADHHISPGKKQWTWGCGDFGKAWDRNLTDEDGPYIELMTGMYCDNQPDFTWLKPYEEKVFYQYFMPYKEVGQVKNASTKAVLGTEFRKEGLYICAYGTEVYEDARIVVYDQGRKVYEEAVRLSPVDIYEKTLALNLTDRYKVKVAVEAGQRELISYQEVDQGIPKLAEPAQAIGDPEKIMTNDELLMAGQHIEQYRHATYLPDPYYLEGLKRDKGDVRINNAYGLLLLRRGDFERAENYFRKALERLTKLHPNPSDSEPYYNLGLSLFYQEQYDDAFDAFYKAIWSSEQQEMGYYYLGAIACRKGEYEEALELLDKGLVKNWHNTKARGLKAAILARMGRREELQQLVMENLQLDQFDYVTRFVDAFCSQDKEQVAAIRQLCRDSKDTILSAARDFMESGLYEEALKTLEVYEGTFPMISYYRAACLEKLEDPAAVSAVQEGEAADPYICFPNKLEDIAVLRTAMRLEKHAAKAPYYLGCLYYDKLDFGQAVALWEQSETCDNQFPTVLRNLSIAYYNKKKEPQKALDHLERAFQLDQSDARIFLELDQLHKKMGYSFQRRIDDFKAHAELITQRDDLYLEYVTVLNQAGYFQEAHQAVTAHNFQTWEGAEGKITAQFKISLAELAKQKLAAAAYSEAEQLIREALSYPESLGEGRLEGTKDNDLYYLLGESLEKQGKEEEAGICHQKATLGVMEPAGMMYYYDQPADMIYYQGKAKEKLGSQAEANARYYKLIDYGEKHLRDTFVMDYFAVSMPDFLIFEEDMDQKNQVHCYYLMGLGKLGLGKKQEAAEAFQKALDLDHNHQNAAIYLRMCNA
ncbi:MAG: DUF5107 domain-containing protein [Lachnospiraceae bacterium]|nr:DUF5107 domain-containing protein [Lachnospiraceae bacterium]